MPSTDPSRLRLVHYFPAIRLEAGGTVRAILDLCGALSEAGHAVTLLTRDAKDVPPQWQHAAQDVPRVIQLGSRAGSLASPRQGRTAAVPHLREADVVHLHVPWEVSNLAFARRAMRLKRPYVVSIHGMLDDWSMAQKGPKKRLFLRIAGRRFLERAATVHFAAEIEREQGLKWIGNAASRTAVVPLIFDTGPFEQLSGRDEARRRLASMEVNAPYVLFLSRVHFQKGIEVLLEALKLSCERGRPWQLVIAGPGERAYLERLNTIIADYGIADHVRFVGMVAGQSKIDLYRGAEVFALPTFQESFGFVLVEAMACGTPVVTTPETDIWRELEQGGATIVEPVPQTFSEAVERLLEAPDREAQGDAGRQFVMDWLRRDKILAQYEQMYRDAMARS